jgi:hypothetical protein
LKNLREALLFFCGASRDISSASERAFPGVFAYFFGCSTPSKGILVP